MTIMSKTSSRRAFLKQTALTTAGLSMGLSATSANANVDRRRILVVVELSGGNDGLNSIVPHNDDSYYRLRPTIGIPKKDLLPLDDHFGFNPGMVGLQKQWQKDQLAIIQSCGYENPSFSHFTSMAYWHTAAPNSGNEYGWVGRLADELAGSPEPNLMINVGTAQSLAVKSRVHNPVVFDDPTRFQRIALSGEQGVLNHVSEEITGNPTREYLNRVATSARDASRLIRQAWSEYSTPIDYGIAPIDLPKVAACIAADLPTQLYYVSFRNNAFDTHVAQPALHQRLLTYACDGINAFLDDMDRIGRADDVLLMAFSEFGRRVPENSNLGTDHGAANVMFMAGRGVKGGHYGGLPNLDQLDAGDNLIPTTDFRSVYATAIDGWMKPGAARKVLGGSFVPIALYA
jgi:uncharacterized protein (DUF1501 family)